MIRPPDGTAAIGIDLGTSSSLVAVWTSITGSIPSVLDLGFSHTRPCQMRSAVAYLEDGVRVTGDPAFHDDENLAKGNVYFHTKRILSKRFHDDIVQDFLKEVPFGSFARPTSRTKEIATCTFEIQASGHDDLTVRPEQISAALLTTLKGAYERYLDQTVTLAKEPVVVITVPANFSNSQRQATLHAAKIANIPNAKLINEPTAAAFGHHLSLKSAMPSDAYVLVFDLGGGTLDVTITHMGYDRELWLTDVFCKLRQRLDLLQSERDREQLLHVFDQLKNGDPVQRYRAKMELDELIDVPVQPSFINVLACDGDPSLGGQDFDAALGHLVKERLFERLQKKYKGISWKAVKELLFDVTFELRLARTCEEQKHVFSTRKSGQFGVRFNKLQLKDRSQERPSAAHMRLLQQSTGGIWKLCRKSSPYEVTMRLERGSNGWYLVWERLSGLTSFLTSTKKLPLKNIIRVDVDVTSSCVKRSLKKKMITAEQSQRIISVTMGDSSSTKGSPSFRTVHFVIIGTDDEGAGVVDDRWAMWLRALRCMSSHYSNGPVDGEAVPYERSADASFDFEGIEIQREEFERAAAGREINLSPIETDIGPRQVIKGRNLWQACIAPIERALLQANLRKEDLSEVLLVGGGTRMPRIHSEIRAFFMDCPRTRLSFSRRSGEPVKAVAIGAAYYGRSRIKPERRDRSVSRDSLSWRTTDVRSMCVMTDIASRSIMLKVKRRTEDKHLFFTLIKKGEFLPYQHSHIFHPRGRSQQYIFLEIYDCHDLYTAKYIRREDMLATSNIQKIGEFKFSLTKDENQTRQNTRALSPKNDQNMDMRQLEICVTFNIDPFGVLTVTAKCPQRTSIGGKVVLHLKDSMALKSSQVAAFAEREKEYARRENQDRSQHAFVGAEDAFYD